MRGKLINSTCFKSREPASQQNKGTDCHFQGPLVTVPLLSFPKLAVSEKDEIYSCYKIKGLQIRGSYIVSLHLHYFEFKI